MNIHKDIINRYDNILGELTPYVTCIPEPGIYFPHLRWMLNELREGKVTGEKAHRWLGFIQGLMVMNELITVSGEREFTRPYLTENANG